jgi:hypothetical protein
VKKRENVTKTHKKRDKKGSIYILVGMEISFGGFEL